MDSHVTVVRPNANLSWPYLGQFMTLKQPEIEAMREGTTGQTELSRGQLGELLILIPSGTVLKAFDDAITPLKQRIATNNQSSSILTTLRDTLLPRLISGQLRLPDTEVLLEKVAA